MGFKMATVLTQRLQVELMSAVECLLVHICQDVLLMHRPTLNFTLTSPSIFFPVLLWVFIVRGVTYLKDVKIFVTEGDIVGEGNCSEHAVHSPTDAHLLKL